MPISPGLPAQPATGISGGHAQLQVPYLVSWPAAPGEPGALDADLPRAAGAAGDGDHRWPCPAAGAVPGELASSTREPVAPRCGSAPGCRRGRRRGSPVAMSNCRCCTLWARQQH